MGKLSTEDRVDFEDHFVDCPECLDQIESTEDFRSALKQVTKKGASWSRSSADHGWLAWLGASGAWAQPRFLVFASGVFVIGLTLVFFAGLRYRQSELARATRTSDEWQSRYAEERQARESLEKQLQASPNSSQEQRTLIASAQAAPLFFLTVTRGSGDTSAPANKVTIPQASPWVVLSLEFEKDPAFRSYRAQLSNAEGRQLWSADQIPPPPSDSLGITLPSSMLTNGNYTLTLDGLTAGNRYVPAAHFSFQAVAKK